MTGQENQSGPSGEPRAATVRGWLLLYLMLSVILDVTAVVLLFTSGSELTSEGNELGLLALLVVAGCVMTGYLITAFVRRHPDAAFLGKHHTVINAIPAACVFYWLFHHTDPVIFALLLFVLLFCGVAIWRNYFGSSSLVKALIPPATRKVGKKEKYLVTFIYVAIGVVIFINAGLDRWWITLAGVWGILSLSPLMEYFPDDSGSKAEPDK